MPVSISLEEEGGETFARFVADPLEKGYGHTLGNALRRMLLTAIESPAIVSFMMEGIDHEYQAVEGVLEDVTSIILNLKGALLRYLPEEGDAKARSIKTIHKVIEITQEDLQETGEKRVTLGELISEGDFDVINPELVVFTATQPTVRKVQIRVGIGRGYIPSERIELPEKLETEILVDAIYTPIKVVSYKVENTRVGQDTDFDKLILEVTTDGRVHPKEALSFAAKLLTKHLTVFDRIESKELIFDEPKEEQEAQDDELLKKLILNINEIELSVRSTNCLSGANIDTIGELVVMPESKLLQFRNFGKKSLSEIKAKLTEMGLCLGMDLTHLGITLDNSKDKIKQLAHEIKSKGEA